jgi:hypothetical protein
VETSPLLERGELIGLAHARRALEPNVNVHAALRRSLAKEQLRPVGRRARCPGRSVIAADFPDLPITRPSERFDERLAGELSDG